jgi:CO/xanthine dehydrogenase FAD-binding subunit
MHPFAYARPRTVAEALDLLGEHGPRAQVLAGGTDLAVAMRNRTLLPEHVVDVKFLADLPPALSDDGETLIIGATAVMADVEHDVRVRELFPALAEAAAVVGSPQIRNRATVVGNICHASPAADTAPALLVHGATVVVAGAHGERRIPLRGFFLGPGRTDLRDGELVVGIELPLERRRGGAAFARVTRRRGVDLATINVCCYVDADGRTRMAFGAVGPRPVLAVDERGVLADPTTTPGTRDDALRAMLAATSPLSDVRGSREYREAMLLVMSRRALRTSLERRVAA